MRFDYIVRPLRDAGCDAPNLADPAIRAVIAASVAINVLVLAVPLYINRIYTSVLPQQAGDSLIVITGLLVGVLVLDLVLKIARAWLLSLMAARSEHGLRLKGLRALLAAPLQASRAVGVSERLEQLRSVTQLRALFEQQWLVRRVDVPFTIVYLLVLALIGGWLALVPLALLPAFLWQAKRGAKRLASAIRARSQAQQISDTVSLACLESAPTIKAFNLEGFLVRRLEPAQERYSQAVFEQEAATAWMQNLSQLFSQWSQLLIVSFGAAMVINQSLSTGALAACTLLSSQVTMPVAKLFTAEAQMAAETVAQSQLQQLQELPAEPLLLQGDPVPAAGDLDLGGVVLPAGQTALLLGGSPHQSAAFLESLTALQGAMPAGLRLAGHPTATMERSQLRQRLRLIKPELPLLHGTIFDHLCQFRPEQLGDRAAALCEAHGVAPQILALPLGYDTRIGEAQDYPIPQGLAFRLQVMQALMDDPAVLLVDGSETTLPWVQLDWLLGLQLSASRLIALQRRPSQPLPKGTRLLQWSQGQLQEVLP